MNPAAISDSEGKKETKLPRRDWVLIPLTALFTILLLAIATELTARWLFPVSRVGLENCFALGDPSGYAPVTPNSVCFERMAESKFLAEYRFDSHGHRASTDLGPKPPGTYRIVMLGSSFAMGLFVPREMSFAAMLPAELSLRTKRKVELYNEATGGKFRGGPFPVAGSALHFNEVLSADPDMVLWIITSADVVNAALAHPASPQQAPAPTEGTNRSGSVWDKLRNAVADGSLAEKLHDHWDATRTSLMLKHLLFANDSADQYVKSYLKNGDQAEFLKSQPSESWQRSLQTFQGDASELEMQARKAGVPFVAVLVPNRAQAAMISAGEWPEGYDPYKLDEELRTIVVQHGGTYVDILHDVRQIADPERYYFPVDGHLDADGHAMIARLLAKELTSGAVPALRVTPQKQTVLAEGR